MAEQQPFSVGIDPSSGNFNIDEVKAAMRHASEENSVLVLYAHNIT